MRYSRLSIIFAASLALASTAIAMTTEAIFCLGHLLVRVFVDLLPEPTLAFDGSYPDITGTPMISDAPPQHQLRFETGQRRRSADRKI